MRDRETPPVMAAGGDASRAAEDWHPVGGALAASIVIHALAIASMTALFVPPSATQAVSAAPGMLFAVLTGNRQPDSPSDAAPAAMTSSASPSTTPSARRAPKPRVAAGTVPWSATSPEIGPPPGLYGPAMVSEGLEFIETRNIVQLGEMIERRVRADFPDDPEYPVVLNPAETLGYPVDALNAGVEGVVLVWFGVDEEGKVIAKEVLDGPAELSEWVLGRVDRLVARPGTNRDGPVRSWVALEIHFSRAQALDASAASGRK